MAVGKIEALTLSVAYLAIGGGGGMFQAGTDAELGERSLLNDHAALAAGLAPTADRLDLDPQRTRGLQDADARGHRPLTSGGLEDDSTSVRLLIASGLGHSA